MMLAEAGCSPPEIVTVTGSFPATSARNLRSIPGTESDIAKFEERLGNKTAAKVQNAPAK
jgi:hypothetical protein